MSRDKQVEEMRKDVASIHRFFFEDDDYEILDDYIADMLFDKGYRKSQEVAREIFEGIEKHLVTGCTFYGQAIHSIGVGNFAELKKKYTQEK